MTKIFWKHHNQDFLKTSRQRFFRKRHDKDFFENITTKIFCSNIKNKISLEPNEKDFYEPGNTYLKAIINESSTKATRLNNKKYVGC